MMPAGEVRTSYGQGTNPLSQERGRTKTERAWLSQYRILFMPPCAEITAFFNSSDTSATPSRESL
jgi:hypothetical protein